MSKKIAALYVINNGPYFDLKNVIPWTESMDARKYRGPYPVIAHPPCKRWGRYWSGGPSARIKRFKGDDNGCFAHALWSVRTFGGILEHPEASHAWLWHGIHKPPQIGGWIKADPWGWTCCVAQGNYGHKAQKLTWLYVVNLKFLPELKWGKTPGRARLDNGSHYSGEHCGKYKQLSALECEATPIAFRNLLVRMVQR